MFGSRKVNHEKSILQTGVATAIAGGAIIGGIMNSNAASGAANTQANAATAAAQLQKQTTEEQLAQQKDMYNQNVTRQQPWVDAGQGAQGQLNIGMGIGNNGGIDPNTGQPIAGYGSLTKNFGAGDLQGNLAPSYDFMKQQGNQGLQSSAAARGGLLTGQGGKDITQFNQNFASTGYQQAYQNFVTNQTNQYNRLSGVSTMGQNAAAGVGAQGTQVSSNMANTAMAGVGAQNNYLTGAAGAQAAGQVGTANAWSGALGQGAMGYGMSQSMGSMRTYDPLSQIPNATAANSTTMPMQSVYGYTPTP